MLLVASAMGSPPPPGGTCPSARRAPRPACRPGYAAGNLYVTDQDNHRVAVFAPDGTPLAQWGSQGSGPGEFDVPTGIAVNRNGTAYHTSSEHG